MKNKILIILLFVWVNSIAHKQHLFKIDTTTLDTQSVAFESHIELIINKLSKIRPSYYDSIPSYSNLGFKTYKCFKAELDSQLLSHTTVILSVLIEESSGRLYDDDYVGLYEFHFDDETTASLVFKSLDKFRDYFGCSHIWYNWYFARSKKSILMIESMENALNYGLKKYIVHLLKTVMEVDEIKVRD